MTRTLIVFELNSNLLDRVYNLTKDLQLNDTSEATTYRQQYPSAPANLPPSVVLGDAMSSDTYFSSMSLTETWERYLNMMTMGQGKYATTNSEDSGTLESLVRADEAGLVDYSRVMVVRRELFSPSYKPRLMRPDLDSSVPVPTLIALQTRPRTLTMRFMKVKLQEVSTRPYRTSKSSDL
jgi:purine nucleoside permease